MGKKRHHRYARQQLSLEDALPTDADHASDDPGRWRLRALAIPGFALIAVFIANIVLGSPDGGTWYNLDVAAMLVAFIALIHVLVLRVLPVTRDHTPREIWGGVVAKGYGGYTRRFGQQVQLYGADDSKRSRWRWWWWGP